MLKQLLRNNVIQKEGVVVEQLYFSNNLIKKYSYHIPLPRIVPKCYGRPLKSETNKNEIRFFFSLTVFVKGLCNYVDNSKLT